MVSSLLLSMRRLPSGMVTSASHVDVKLSTTPLSPVVCQTRDPDRIVAPSESRQDRGGVQSGAGGVLVSVTVHAPFCTLCCVD